MDGILNINKAAGMTSFGVVARVKRLTGEKHCGHAGTLDPLATGVLPVCLGQAARVVEYLVDESKTYLAEIRLGVTTDSYDSAGKVLSERDCAQISRPQFEEVLKHFRGSISQVPPMFSALKHQGQPLYRLARAGQEVERRPRAAIIYKLELTDWRPPLFSLEIECSKGTYIRSLAHDIGQELGCGAIMQGLQRTRVGDFRIEESVTLEQLESACQSGGLEKLLYPSDFALSAFPAIIVAQEQQCALVHGRPVAAAQNPDLSDGKIVRVYNQSGDFVGMVKYSSGESQWQAQKIFIKKCCQMHNSPDEESRESA